MERFVDLPINRKVRRAILMTTIPALFISVGCISVYEWYSVTQGTVEAASTLADIIGAGSTGAIAFGDTGAADAILAGLKFRKSTIAARIFKDKEPFATFIRADAGNAELPALPLEDQSIVSGDRIKVFRSVSFRDDKIGTVYLESDMGTLYLRLWRYLNIAMFIVALLLLPVYLFSKHIQQLISTPIEDLVRLAQEITLNSNYSLRAKETGNAEVAKLTRTFNEMLQKIESSNKKLVEQAEALWRSNKELEQFAYVSSHDLQEPLRKITTYSQLLELKYKGKIDDEANKYIENICLCVDRMRTLIKDLLAYSRLSREDETYGEVDLNQTMSGVLADMEPAILSANAIITHDPLPVVHSNLFQMQQLFQNLIGNAIKFHGAESPIVSVSCKKESNEWLFGVHDNGIGIDPKYHKQIFKVFQRLHGRDVYAGTGIGLAICEKIVEQRGGKIWVESAPGKGANFYFTWPIQTPKDSAGAAVPHSQEIFKPTPSPN